MSTRRANAGADEEMGHVRSESEGTPDEKEPLTGGLVAPHLYQSQSAVASTHTASPSTSEQQEQEQPTMFDTLAADIGISGYKKVWHRIKGKGRSIGWLESLKAAALSSWLNVLLVLIPLSWAAHFAKWSHNAQFVLSFFAIMPLEKLFDWGGEQLALFCGEDLGDLIIVTLNNAVEATLAIILLVKCELKLLQSTIAGVALLHLLLIPGTSFLVGGARVLEQTLHPHRSQLNHTLLTIGILALVIPAGFFAAIDRGPPTPDAGAVPDDAINDTIRMDFLRMGRGFAVILLAVYILSRFYLHDPPGEGNAFQPHQNAPAEILEKERELAEAEPETNPLACVLVMCVTVALMGVTAEFVIGGQYRTRTRGGEHLRRVRAIPFSADCTFPSCSLTSLTLLDGSASSSSRSSPGPPTAPSPSSSSCARPSAGSGTTTPSHPPRLPSARDRAQHPVPALLDAVPRAAGVVDWEAYDRAVRTCTLTRTIDLFEVTALIGSCFLVNYVTADAKTNWAEGSIMISFYIMIALSAWYYPGQPEINIMSACGSVLEALATGGGVEE
ncbi:hypothetical protein EVG20_g2922 [Dentipellis fragilis]|uniref:Sodium/calcium exchanger membrane region domain-containing protein n=1 Tax=Dentipellis fragilis TaxID=205917 RepID=A0A4Y9Z802_9AGAM|nr:hypothetical protein EVG20_g2922 [Dentipellis fragilis]